jgi:hypothetical protein
MYDLVISSRVAYSANGLVGHHTKFVSIVYMFRRATSDCCNCNIAADNGSVDIEDAIWDDDDGSDAGIPSLADFEGVGGPYQSTRMSFRLMKSLFGLIAFLFFLFDLYLFSLRLRLITSCLVAASSYCMWSNFRPVLASKMRTSRSSFISLKRD